MWYLGEVVCPVIAGAGQRNVMDGKALRCGGVAGGAGEWRSTLYRCPGVFLLPAAPLECGLGHAGGGSAGDGRMGEGCGSKRRRLSAPLVRFFALLFAPATHTTRPDCS